MRTTLIASLICAGAAASIAAGSIASADEPVFPTAGSESATATVADLESQGFDVVVNFLQGNPNVPLSECRVNGINDPSHMVPAALSTVYVDVLCPNAK
jgi:hypothetical protein